MAFKIDERTLADWLNEAGEHAVRVQDHLACQGQLDLGQVYDRMPLLLPQNR
ncbi:hypothetical protein Q0M94_10695 [Deinococcus radiomollis]|uniref:hypothetical protein n=1 Tax=Deinococcus radiomollis TaxID=468916 RepID=UPI0038917838